MRKLTDCVNYAWPAAALVCVAVALLPACAATAGTFLANWQGVAGGAWSTPGNWDINQVPANTATDTYNVRVDAGAGNVDLDIAPTVNNYTQATGSLIGSQAISELTVNGTTTWNSGTIDTLTLKANGPLTIAKLLAGAPNPTLGAAYLYVKGATTASNTPIDALGGAVLGNDGTFNVNLNTQFNDISGGNGNQPKLNNYGTLNKLNGNGTTTVAWSVYSTGEIHSQTGELKFTGGLGVYGGRLLVDQGATITSTTPIIVNGASVGGAGTINGTIKLTDGRIRGAPTPGKLEIFGDLISDIGGGLSTSDSSVGGPGSWSDYNDQVVVHGNVQLPSLLDISVWPGYTPPYAYEYDVLLADGTISGYFQNAFSGQRALSDDGKWSFIVNYGNGDFAHKVALTDFEAVPEPSALGLAAAGIFLLWRWSCARGGKTR